MSDLTRLPFNYDFRAVNSFDLLSDLKINKIAFNFDCGNIVHDKSIFKYHKISFQVLCAT